MKNQVLFIILLLITAACRQLPNNIPQARINYELAFPNYETLSAQDQEKADSLLALALDHEALYSLMGDLKPISSIGFSLSYPIGKDSTRQDGQRDIVDTDADSIRTVLADLEQWNRIIDALSFDNYQFILVPFKNVYNGTRHLQILLCRRDLIDSLLVEHDVFFAQWGFVPGTEPEVLLSVIEYEDRRDRYRAYGHLFGYPSHAVDFFVDADQTQEETGEFVDRSFFQIPVYESTSGHFTYALPEEFQPSSADSSIYYQAVEILESYRQLRPRFINENGQLNSIDLYRHWWGRKQRIANIKS